MPSNGQSRRKKKIVQIGTIYIYTPDSPRLSVSRISRPGEGEGLQWSWRQGNVWMQAARRQHVPQESIIQGCEPPDRGPAGYRPQLEQWPFFFFVCRLFPFVNTTVTSQQRFRSEKTNNKTKRRTQTRNRKILLSSII